VGAAPAGDQGDDAGRWPSCACRAITTWPRRARAPARDAAPLRRAPRPRRDHPADREGPGRQAVAQQQAAMELVQTKQALQQCQEELAKCQQDLQAAKSGEAAKVREAELDAEQEAREASRKAASRRWRPSASRRTQQAEAERDNALKIAQEAHRARQAAPHHDRLSVGQDRRCRPLPDPDRAGGGTSVTSGAANAYTASAVQLIASTAAALYITGVHAKRRRCSRGDVQVGAADDRRRRL
jgi:hypothetical protein